MTDSPQDGSLFVGLALAPRVRLTSTVVLFRYSAATWNTHRIHYDHDYALAEGYPGVLVQSHLHGALLAQYCTDWSGPQGRLLTLALRVRRFAVAGEQLTVAATITALEELDDDRAVVSLELTETRGSDGEHCVSATARVDVPARWLRRESAEELEGHPW